LKNVKEVFTTNITFYAAKPMTEPTYIVPSTNTATSISDKPYFFYIFDHLKIKNKNADWIDLIGITPKLTENLELNTKLIVYQYKYCTYWYMYFVRLSPKMPNTYNVGNIRILPGFTVKKLE